MQNEVISTLYRTQAYYVSYMSGQDSAQPTRVLRLQQMILDQSQCWEVAHPIKLLRDLIALTLKNKASLKLWSKHPTYLGREASLLV